MWTAFDRSSAGTWKTKFLFTSRDYDKALFLESDLSERELADIGLNVVSRLVVTGCVALSQTRAHGRAKAEADARGARGMGEASRAVGKPSASDVSRGLAAGNRPCSSA
jgi:hypothetical protein